MKIIILIVILISATVGGLMVFQPVSTDNSNASNLNQVNELARQVQAGERTQIFKDDAGTRRVLLGKGADDFYGLKVSPPGTDVYTATDLELYFNSNRNTLKVVASDTVSLASESVASGTIGDRSVTVNFPTQTTTPIVLAYGNDNSAFDSGFFLWGGTKVYSWGVTGSGITLYEMETLEMRSTTSSATFKARYSNGQGTTKSSPAYTITYFILQETIH